MSYRRFARPNDHGWTTADWIGWLQEQHVAPSVLSNDEGICSLCRAPTRIGPHGTPYERCYECRHTLSTVLDGVVPMCYSIHDGLESILWRSKNQPSDSWLRLPLGSLLWTFMKKHFECIEGFYGGAFDVHIAMPSHPSTRGGVSHLDTLIGNVHGFANFWDSDVLTKNDASKAGARRGRIIPDLFTAKPVVSGKRVLLFDDTFTTGGSMASAAHALKRSGAVSVVGLTFGRQLNAEWKDSKDFVASLSSRELEIDECAVHEGRPMDLFDLCFRQPG